MSAKRRAQKCCCLIGRRTIVVLCRRTSVPGGCRGPMHPVGPPPRNRMEGRSLGSWALGPLAWHLHWLLSLPASQRLGCGRGRGRVSSGGLYRVRWDGGHVLLLPSQASARDGGMDSYRCRELGAPDASLLSLEGGISPWRKGVSVSEHVAFISEQHKCP